MHRRDISKALFATAAGSALVGRQADAQTCTAPCFAQTDAESAISVTPTNLGYPQGDVRRYGADPTGTNDSTTAINNAISVMYQAASSGTLGVGAAVVNFPAGTFKICKSIVAKSYVTLQGNFGEDGTFGVQTSQLGTELNWMGWGAGPILQCYDVRLFKLDGIQLQGNSGTSIVGILLDSNNSPSGSQNEFHRFSIRNCFLGIHWGTSGLTNAYANDSTRFVNGTIWSAVADSSGIVINSGNAGDESLIDGVGIEVQNVGINVTVASLLTIRRCFGGNNLSGGFIVLSTAIGITISECSSEGWGGNPSEYRSANSNFLTVNAPQGGFAINNFTINMANNQINNPIVVNYAVRIISIGDCWGQCQNSSYTGIVSATGIFTNGVSSVVAINNGVNPGSIDITTGPYSDTPTQGWQDSGFVDLTRFDPWLGAFQPSFTAASYTANGSMTWTVAANNVAFTGYTLVNRIMTIFFNVSGSTIGGMVNTDLMFQIPSSKAASQPITNTCVATNNGVQTGGVVLVFAGDTYIRFRLLAGGNWTLSSNAGVQGQISFEVI